ncbi:HdaA/DnaA family protein [Glacieibacterium megasporae]|uniref:HdaA/DnaA family protein n=1 Tax=Glacieibacterium megasporae TaxID=2835787 RepID=UPI001C1E15D2|nr:chromosomal replication initiator DnaA [Polymorphobacter megasporae]UAJ09482.1 chromosomal replication initiator DnaA [Polymorphobacter megasporae]
MPQLPLPLAYPPAQGRADFVIAAANADAVAWLAGAPAPRSLLVGPPGSGKTHLGRIFAERHQATLIDDADRRGDDVALFHAWNAASAAAPLLMTAQALPRYWIKLPDLASRLAATPTLVIAEPDDALLAAVIAKQFADRGVRVTPDVIGFIVLRIERSFAAAAATVAAIESVGLASRRDITVPLARDVLARDVLGRQRDWIDDGTVDDAAIIDLSSSVG